MQYQNDDMDELFRRAADGYPLKMQQENWDAVAGKLSAPAVTGLGINNKKSDNNNYKPATLIMLLFVIGGATILMLLNKPNKNFDNKALRKNEGNIQAGIVNKNYPDKSNNRKALIKNDERASATSSVGEETNTREIQKQILGRAAFTKTTISQAEILFTDEFVENKNEKKGNENKPYETNTATGGINNKNDLGKLLKEKQEKNLEIPSKTDSVNTAKAKQIKKQKFFYVGVFAGPQFNQVKSQGFSNSGFSAGVLLGVNITKNLAVETGLFLSQKKYYSSGKYFNMKNIDASMPASMKVISLNGKSKVLEIPVKIKYNFREKSKGNFFGTVGAVSYILTNENNKYLVDLNGNQQKVPANYSKNEKYFDAAVNLSAGYEYKLKQTKIRIEPYVQVPLKSIGVGSMPIMSTGVNVGVTLPFH